VLFHKAGSGNGGLEGGRVRGREVGGDGAHLPGQLARVPHGCGDVVADGAGLLEEFPADAAGRREDR